jgi:hypothetical protein
MARRVPAHDGGQRDATARAGFGDDADRSNSPSHTLPAKRGMNQYEKPNMMAISADDDARVWDGGWVQLYRDARADDS